MNSGATQCLSVTPKQIQTIDIGIATFNACVAGRIAHAVVKSLGGGRRNWRQQLIVGDKIRLLG